MPTDEYDPFKFHSGLPEDFEGTIDDAYFMYDPEYNNGQTLLLKLEIKCADPEIQDSLQRPLQYSVGTGFEPIEGGKAIERADGSNKGFHVNSAVANLLTSMLGCGEEAEKVLRGPGRGNPFRAELYIGTTWFWERRTFKYGGEIGDKDRLMPTKFIGVKGSGSAGGGAGGSGPVKKAPAKKAAAPAKAAAPKLAAPVEELPADANTEAGLIEGTELWNNLWAIAMQVDSHGQFVEQAFELEGVADNEGVSSAVLDDGEGSLWAKAVAEYEATNS